MDLKQDLTNVGVSLDDLNAIILTHHHSDHCGMLSFIEPNIKIIGPKNISYYMGNKYLSDVDKYIEELELPRSFKNDIQSVWYEEKLDQITNNEIVSSNQEVEFLSEYGIRIIEMSGHSKCDLIISDREGNIFSGDIVIPGVFLTAL